MTMTLTRAEQPRGHLPDGSGVQKHSAGDHYPYVIEAKGGPDGLLWGVFGPDKPREQCDHRFGSAREARDHARDLAAKFRARVAEPGGVVVRASNRFDLAGLSAALRALEGGAPFVRVTFDDAQGGALDVVFRPADLPALRQKMIYSM